MSSTVTSAGMVACTMNVGTGTSAVVERVEHSIVMRIGGVESTVFLGLVILKNTVAVPSTVSLTHISGEVYSITKAGPLVHVEAPVLSS